MSYALSVLTTDLRARFRDVAGNFISAVPATNYLNVAFENFTNDTECNWREFGFYITGKQYVYTLPADCLHTLTAMWYQNGQYEIPFLSEQEFKARGNMNRRISVSTPQSYTIVQDGSGAANSLLLGPAPGTTSNTSMVNPGSISALQTSINVSDATKFQSPAGMVLIDSEQIIYQNQDNLKPGNLLLCLRGKGGTAAAVHSSCAVVYRLDLVITYTYAYKYMAATTDTPNIPLQYQKIPIHYALALALKQDGRDKQAMAEMEEYMALRKEAKRQVRIQTRDKNNRRISTAYS